MQRSRPAAADLPNVSWGRLAIEEADNIGYENIAKFSGGKYLVSAAYDNLVENYDLNGMPKNDEESRSKAVNSSLPLQKLLVSMKHSAAESNYSQADVERIDSVLSDYNGTDYLNNRAYTLDSTDGRVVYTKDMVRILDLAKVSYQEESAHPSE